jgi:hypothetical protein
MNTSRRRFLQNTFGASVGFTLSDDVLDILDRIVPRPVMVRGRSLAHKLDSWVEITWHTTDGAVDWLSQWTPWELYSGVPLSSIMAAASLPIPAELAARNEQLLESFVPGVRMDTTLQVARRYTHTEMSLHARGARA